MQRENGFRVFSERFFSGVQFMLSMRLLRVLLPTSCNCLFIVVLFLVKTTISPKRLDHS